MGKEIPKLLKVGQFAKRYDINRQTIYKMIRAGELKHIEVGGMIRLFPLEEEGDDDAC